MKHTYCVNIRKWICLTFVTIWCERLLLAVDNDWTNAASGKWETPANWSAGVAPSDNFSTITITNTGFKTVTIDAVTTNTPGAMTITNLLVSAPAGFTNTLALSNAGSNVALRVIDTLTISNGCLVTITNAAVKIEGRLGLTHGLHVKRGALSVDSGSLACITNVNSLTLTTRIGVLGSGSLTVRGGSVSLGNVNVGESSGSQGAMNILGGATTFAGFLSIGNLSGATGAVWVSGGTLQGANNYIYAGDVGAGQMTISNGTVQTPLFEVAHGSGSAGTLTMLGGTCTVTSSEMIIANAAGNNASVFISGGQLSLLQSNIVVGRSGNGQMTISGGNVQAYMIDVCEKITARGTLTVSGGTVTMLDSLQVGDNPGATGTVWLTGGTMVMTNVNSSHVGDDGVGIMVISNGTVLVSELKIGNGNPGVPSPAVGTLTMSAPGGSILCSSNFFVGRFGGATGAVWMAAGQLTVTNGANNIGIGLAGYGQMTVSNGTILTRELTMGETNGGFGVVNFLGGNLTITRPTLDGELDVRRGTYTLTGGTNNFDSLIVTNATGSFIDNGGLINVRATAITNGATFFIGDGINPATYHLLGGVHSFPAGLNIRVNGQLTGCGTINGPVLNSGTVTIDCIGGSLTFTGIVTNNGTIRPLNGSVLEGYGLFVNNGIIDITSGGTNFHGGFINNGTVLSGSPDTDGDGLTDAQELLAGTDPNSSTSRFAVAYVAIEGNSLRIRWMMGPNKTNALQRAAGSASGSYTTNFADIFTVTNTVGTATNYLDTGVLVNPPRYYRIRLVP